MALSPEALRAARLNAGLTQEKAAYEAGTTVSTLRGAETGRTEPRIAVLARLAALYGVTVDELLTAGTPHAGNGVQTPARPPDGGIEGAGTTGQEND